MTERQYLDYPQDIVESINDIESFVSNMDFDAFCGDKKTIWKILAGWTVCAETGYSKRSACVPVRSKMTTSGSRL